MSHPRQIGADTGAPLEEEYPFFPVTPLKLVVMSLVTFGLYDVFWIYRNWNHLKVRSDPDIRPVWRTFFNLFYIYALFKAFDRTLRTHGLRLFLGPGLLALVYLISFFLAELPLPYTILSFIGLLPLYLVQTGVRQLQTELGLEPDANGEFSSANRAAVFLGGLIWFLRFLSLFIPEPEADGGYSSTVKHTQLY